MDTPIELKTCDEHVELSVHFSEHAEGCADEARGSVLKHEQDSFWIEANYAASRAIYHELAAARLAREEEPKVTLIQRGGDTDAQPD